MVYIKNITETNLFIPDFGINLLPNEIRDISEFSNRQKLQDYSDVFIDLLNVNKIFLLDADLNVMKTSIAVKYICNAYDIIKVDSNLNNKFYYFLKDNFELNRNSIVDKHFIGRVKTLYILSDSTDIIVSIESGNGLKMHDETLIKRQTLELSFDSDIEDICVSLKIPESAGVKTSVEIFIWSFFVFVIVLKITEPSLNFIDDIFLALTYDLLNLFHLLSVNFSTITSLLFLYIE